MKARTILYGLVLLPLLCAIAVAARAQTASPQETLNQYVADLQKNPDDTALREKIIALAQTMRPAPTIPEQARRHMDRGIAASEGAKGEEDFRAASDEFTKATDLAPWLGDAYRNLAIAQDRSGQYDAALNNLRLYLLTLPSPADESWARSLINKVEYRKEKALKEAAKKSRPEVVAERSQNTFEDLLKKIAGRRYLSTDGVGNIHTLDVEGEFLVQNRDLPGPRMRLGPITGYRSTCLDPHSQDTVITLTISEDGTQIAEHVVRNGPNAATGDWIWLWQR